MLRRLPIRAHAGRSPIQCWRSRSRTTWRGRDNAGAPRLCPVITVAVQSRRAESRSLRSAAPCTSPFRFAFGGALFVGVDGPRRASARAWFRSRRCRGSRTEREGADAEHDGGDPVPGARELPGEAVGHSCAGGPGARAARSDQVAAAGDRGTPSALILHGPAPSPNSSTTAAALDGWVELSAQRQDDRAEGGPRAFVIAQPDRDLLAGELTEHCKQRLAASRFPRWCTSSANSRSIRRARSSNAACVRWAADSRHSVTIRHHQA